MDPIIIGIGYKKGSGKDTIANRLVDKHGFIKFSFADTLKQACKAIFHLSDQQLYGDLKEIIDPRWNLTPREILQKVGTDSLRGNFDPDLWFKSTQFKIDNLVQLNPDQQLKFVIPDVRFLNEVKNLKQLPNSFLWKVNRDTIKNNFSGHISETELDNFNQWDLEFNNNSDMKSLYDLVDKQYQALFTKETNDFNKRKSSSI